MRISPAVSKTEYTAILSKQGFYIDPPYHQSWGWVGRRITYGADLTMFNNNLIQIRDYLISLGWKNYKFIAAFLAFVSLINGCEIHQPFKINLIGFPGWNNQKLKSYPIDNINSAFNPLVCDRAWYETRLFNGVQKQVRCLRFNESINPPGWGWFKIDTPFVGTSNAYNETYNTKGVPITDFDYGNGSDPNEYANSPDKPALAFRFEKEIYDNKDFYSHDIQNNDWDHLTNRYGMMGVYPASRYIGWCMSNGRQWRNNYQSQLDFLDNGGNHIWEKHDASHPSFPVFDYKNVKDYKYVPPSNQEINSYLGKAEGYYDSDVLYGAVFLNMINTGVDSIIDGWLLTDVETTIFNENWYIAITDLTKMYYDHMTLLPPYKPPYVRKPSTTNYAMNVATGNNKKRYIFMK